MMHMYFQPINEPGKKQILISHVQTEKFTDSILKIP